MEYVPEITLYLFFLLFDGTEQPLHGQRSEPPDVLWCGHRDSHRFIATVDTLHLSKSSLLITLPGEANESVATGHTCLARAASALSHRRARLPSTMLYS
jgi:hypothetical protein